MQTFYNWGGSQPPKQKTHHRVENGSFFHGKRSYGGVCCAATSVSLPEFELVGITKMMLENRVNITSLHPCFPVTCNIGEDKKNKIVKLPKKNTCLTHSCVEPKRATLRELRLCPKLRIKSQDPWWENHCFRSCVDDFASHNPKPKASKRAMPTMSSPFFSAENCHQTCVRKNFVSQK